MDRFVETLYPDYGQEFSIDRIHFQHRTDHQELMIFQNPIFGRVMVLDGVVQTTERDEFIYHEMLAHVPILGHGQVERLLIVGGGDGGLLREVVKHRNLQRIVQAEIDAQVIETSRRYLPNHACGAFEDPRLQLIIGDGLQFLRETEEQFDLILCDSTDPIGPGAALFSEAFYAAVQQRLRKGGLFAAQNGVPFHQLDELRKSYRALKPLFEEVRFYGAAVPSYVGGIMAFVWATDDRGLSTLEESTLTQRYQQAGLQCRYYSPEIHRAAFALPPYILQALQAA